MEGFHHDTSNHCCVARHVCPNYQGVYLAVCWNVCRLYIDEHIHQWIHININVLSLLYGKPDSRAP